MKKFLSGFLVLCLSLALLTACGTGGQTGKTVTAGVGLLHLHVL